MMIRTCSFGYYATKKLIPAWWWQLMWLRRVRSHGAVEGVSPVSHRCSIQVKVAVVLNPSLIPHIPCIPLLLHLCLLLMKISHPFHHLLHNTIWDSMIHHLKESPALQRILHLLYHLLSTYWIFVDSLEVDGRKS
ncbi:hypothetical protein Hanom_Chr03g00276251 [Helianthus anomalus]